LFEIIINFIKDWVDLLWVVFIFIVFRKGEKLRAILFVLACITMLRLQVQFIFLALSYYSKDSSNYVYLAASIGTFVLSFVASSIIMLL